MYKYNVTAFHHHYERQGRGRGIIETGNKPGKAGALGTIETTNLLHVNYNEQCCRFDKDLFAGVRPKKLENKSRVLRGIRTRDFGGCAIFSCVIQIKEYSICIFHFGDYFIV